MTQEAIILAGGLGTRLKSVVAELPKSLAPVAGKPFLEYLLNYAGQQGINKFVFALGYKTELIEEFVKSFLAKEQYTFSIEEQPLGTGGAIYKSCHQIESENAIVLNADTFFGIDYFKLSSDHELNRAACTLALKPMLSFDRYGVVDVNDQNQIVGFSEKKYHEEGLINGGVYVLNVKSFLQKSYPQIFSFEKDYLEKEYVNKKIFGMISDAYFIDIGIPEDYKKAQKEILLELKDQSKHAKDGPDIK
jgi:D-glycero-alpha-D-manno-heptose 1-phosphate guanylyltransferase